MDEFINMDALLSLDRICPAIQNGKHPPSPMPGLLEPTSVIALFMLEPKIRLLFIQKADTPNYAWANQMAFPGGHQDETDLNTEQTALRELEEEMGIVSKNVEIIGSIGHFQTLNNKDIEAWTGIWNQKDTIVYDSLEIQQVFEIDLNYLVSIHKEKRFHIHEPDFLGLIYPYQDVIIWGVTAKIVCHLINLILKNQG